MRLFLNIIAGGVLAAGSLITLAAQDFPFPADVFDTATHNGHIKNVTTYAGVDPTGTTDSTDGLQQAISDIFGQNAGLEPRDLTLYFPNGTYLISRTLNTIWYSDTTGNTTAGSNIITNVASTAKLGVGYLIVSPDLPAGTTVTEITSSTQLKVKNAATGTHAGVALQYQTNAYRFRFVGQSRAGVTIKLGNASNTSGNGGNGLHQGTDFTNAANAHAMLETEPLAGGQNAFDNSVWNMTLDTGTNNPGAVGILFRGQNIGSVRNVTIKATGATSGYCGLQLTSASPGPCMIENVEIDGFKYGVLLSQAHYGVTFEYLTLRDQVTTGFVNSGNGAFIRKLSSFNANTAAKVIDNGTNSLLVLIDSSAAYTGSGLASTSAITNAASPTVPGAAFVRNFTNTGYAKAVANPNTGGPNTSGDGLAGQVNGAGVSVPVVTTEYSTHPALTPGLANSSVTSLNLPIQDTPFFTDNNLATWYSVGNKIGPDLAFSDQSVQIQAAIDAAVTAGKTTLYFPPGRYFLKNPITVYGSIRRIIGFGAFIMPGAANDGTGSYGTNNANNLQPLIIIGALTNSLEIDFLQVSPTSGGGAPVANVCYTTIQHNSAQKLTLRDFGAGAGSATTVAYKGAVGAGDLFLDDVDGSNWNFSSTQRVWGRQVNPEGDTAGNAVGSKYAAKITNDGGDFWVLGLKTEAYGTLVKSVNGASTEVLGAWAWAVHAVGGTHLQTTLNNNLFEVQNSDFSAAYMTYTSTGNPDYPRQVGQTEGAQSGVLLAAATGTPAAYLRKSVTNASIAPLVVASPDLPLALPGVDIGAVGLTGTGSAAGGVYTVSGAGATIGGYTDAFHFCSQPVTGDCTITAQVLAIPGTISGAKVGVMVRDTINPDSAMVMCALLHGQANFIIRPVAGAFYAVALQGSVAPPYWVRLVRTGNNFKAYTSPNGTPTSWTQVGGIHTLTLGSSAPMVGLAVTSGTTTQLCSPTFSNVTITSP